MDTVNQSARPGGPDASALYGQFLLVEDATAPTPPGWATHQIDRWTLAAHPMLGVLPVRRTSGGDRAIGWLVGMAAHSRDVDPRLVRHELRLDLPAAPSAIDDAIERQLYRLGGRWACVLLAGDVRRMYLDASGSLATVYAAVGPKRIASTTTMLAYPNLDAYRARCEAVPRFQPNKFYPADLTNDDDARRLLPNHYLDLSTWSAVRHWPTGPVARVADGAAAGEAVARIASSIRGTILAVAREHPLALGLSAGRDSRMILACARDVADRFAAVFSFFYKGDVSREIDVVTARKISRALRLPFRQLALPQPSDEVRRDYLYRIGYGAHWGKASDFYQACRREVNLDTVLLTGFGGELGRLFYWHESGPAEREPLSGRECLERCFQEPSPRNVAAMDRWVAGLPRGLDRMMIADLLYNELRSGCWSGPQAYGTAPFRGQVAPFAHRDAIAGTMALPVAFRKDYGLADAVIARAWPRLAAWPFQRYSGFDALRRRAKRRLNDLAERLRQLLRWPTPAPRRPLTAAAVGGPLRPAAVPSKLIPSTTTPATTPPLPAIPRYATSART